MTSSERMKKLWKTKAWQNKIKRAVSLSLRKLWNDPKWRKAQSAKQRAGWVRRGNKPRKKWSAESKQRKRAQTKKWWSKNKTAFLTPERRTLLRNQSRRTYSSEMQTKRITALKKAWKNPKRRSELCAMAAERLRIQTHHTPHPYTCRKGRRFNFRSGEQYELGCAKILDARKLTWLYEPHVLRLSDGRAYVPDFWVKEWKTYVEVKGWERRVDKVEQARKDGFPVLLVRSLSELP